MSLTSSTYVLTTKIFVQIIEMIKDLNKRIRENYMNYMKTLLSANNKSMTI